MVDQTKTYGNEKYRSAAEVVPYHDWNPWEGGWVKETMPGGSVKNIFKPPSQTIGKKGENINEYAMYGQDVETPIWNIIKTLPRNTENLFLPDGKVNRNAKYDAIVKDRYSNYVLFSGTSQEIVDQAEELDYIYSKHENADWPRFRFVSHPPKDMSDPEDLGLPFKFDPDSLTKFWGKRERLDYDPNVSHRITGQLAPMIQGEIGPEDQELITKMDLRGTQTVDGKYIQMKSKYFPTTILRDVGKVIEPVMDTGRAALGHGVKWGFAVSGYLVDGADIATDLIAQTVGDWFFSKDAANIGARKKTLSNRNDLSRWLHRQSDDVKESIYDIWPNTFTMLAGMIAQPTQEQVEKGTQAFHEMDLRTFLENPNQSAFSKILAEFNIGLVFMKAFNLAFRTIPKGLSKYEHMINKGKEIFLERQALKHAKEVKRKVPRNKWEFSPDKSEEKWKLLTSSQKDNYAKMGLSREIKRIWEESGNVLTGSYRHMTTKIRFDVGQKLLTPSPGIMIAGKPVRLHNSFFASEEFATNAGASIAAIYMSDIFEAVGLPPTAGYLFGALSGGFLSTSMYNKNFFYRGQQIPFRLIAGIRDVVGGSKKVDDIVKYDEAGRPVDLNEFELSQLEHVTQTIKSMDPDQQEVILGNMDAYIELIGRLEKMGGNSKKLALKLQDVANLSSIRVAQEALMEQLDLGIGVNLNIKNLEKVLEQERGFLKEIDGLVQNTLGGVDTVSEFGEKSAKYLENMGKFYRKELKDLDLRIKEMDLNNKMFIKLGDMASYAGEEGMAIPINDLFNRLDLDVKLTIIKAKNELNIVDPNDPRLGEIVIKAYNKAEADYGDDMIKWVTDMVSSFKSKDISDEELASGFVGLFERRLNELKLKSKKLYAGFANRLDATDYLDISKWSNDFILSGEGTLVVGKKSTKRIIKNNLPPEYQYLAEDILGDELSQRTALIIKDIADESGATVEDTIKNLNDVYNIEITDGLKFYKWINEGSAQAAGFIEAYGLSTKPGHIRNFSELKITGEGLIAIKGGLNGHKNRLYNKIKAAQKAGKADPADVQAYNALLAFDQELDVLFKRTFKNNAYLDEWTTIAELYARDIAPSLHSDFRYNYGNYARTARYKGEVTGRFGTNRLYGEKAGIGKLPQKWTDDLIKDIISDPDKAAKYLENMFGDLVQVPDGKGGFQWERKIVNPSYQVGLAAIINEGFHRFRNVKGATYFRGKQLRGQERTAGLKDMPIEILAIMENETKFAELIKIKAGTFWKRYDDAAGSNMMESALKDRYIYDVESQVPFVERTVKSTRNLPDHKVELDKARATWYNTSLDVWHTIEKRKQKIQGEMESLRQFFKEGGVAFDRGTFNISKAYQMFTENATGDPIQIQKYKDYFYKANRNDFFGNQAGLDAKWKEHIHNLMVRGLIDTQTESLESAIGTELKRLPDGTFVSARHYKLKSGFQEHLIDYKNVFIETIGEKAYNELLDISSFFLLKNPSGKIRGAIKNIPVDKELSAIMSRVYAMLRKVVSKHYVATEYYINSMRTMKGKLLGALLSDPEMISFVRDSLKDPDKITVERATRIKAIMPKIFHTFSADDALYDELYFYQEEGEPPIEEGTLVPRRQGFYGGGKISINQQMNNLNFQ